MPESAENALKATFRDNIAKLYDWDGIAKLDAKKLKICATIKGVIWNYIGLKQHDKL